MDCIRKEVEAAIKQLAIDRQRAFEVSKLEYDAIVRRIEKTFVRDEGDLHWSNLGGFKPRLDSVTVDSYGNMQWYYSLAEMLPDKPVFVGTSRKSGA